MGEIVKLPTDATYRIICLYLFSVFGSLLFWVRCNLQGRQRNGFGDAVALFLPRESKLYPILEFVLFVLLGGLVGLVLAGPGTVRQALAGGIAWAQMVQVKGRNGS